MAATGVQANWDAVSFSSTPINHVNSIRFSEGGGLETYKGDNSVYPELAANLTSRPTISLTSADVATLRGFPKGQAGVFTGKQLDAKQAAGGAIVWTASNAYVDGVDMEQGHGAFGSATMNLILVAPDGVTNPLSFTRE